MEDFEALEHFVFGQDHPQEVLARWRQGFVRIFVESMSLASVQLLGNAWFGI
jgi:hypothetical protein